MLPNTIHNDHVIYSYCQLPSNVLYFPGNSNYDTQIGIEIGIDQKTEFIAKIGSFDTDTDSDSDPDPDPDPIKMRIAAALSPLLTMDKNLGR